MEEKSKIIESIYDISYNDIYIKDTFERIYNKYIIIKKLIIYFSFIIFFSLILRIFFKRGNKSINKIIIKNNIFINKFDNNNNKDYIIRNEFKKNQSENNISDNFKNINKSNKSYNLIYNKNFIKFNNQINLFHNSEIINQKEKKNFSISSKLELFEGNETLIYKSILEEIKKYKNNKFNISFDKKEDFYERIAPKISIIITVYNQKPFLNIIYACIQNQSLKDIEIIFVDDASIDNSSIVINNLIKKDKRIKYIKNSINKGQFYSRYKGIKMSKGEYILVIDPDDLLLNNILIKAYELATNFNLDIVQFYHIKGKLNENVVRKLNISGIYYYPQIKNIFFNCSYRYLWDKLIKRNIYLESIGFIKEKYRNTRIIIHNDEVACYGVFRIAKSYGILEQIGYFYNRDNPNSITKYNFRENNINGRFHTLFTIMDFYYEQSDNNTFDKTMGGYNFFEVRVNYMYSKQIKYLTRGFLYINYVLDLYINSSFFNKDQKNNLKLFKIKINNQKNKIYKKYIYK